MTTETDTEHVNEAAESAALSEDVLELLGAFMSGVDNPYAYYAELRQKEPRLQIPGGPCVLFRREDVATVLRDARMGLMFVDRNRELFGGEVFDNSRLLQSKKNWMFYKDPPDHARLRGLLKDIFSAKAVAAMAPTVQALVDEHLDRVLAMGTFDVVQDFSHSLTVDTMGQLFGVPPEGRARFSDWAILFDSMPGMDSFDAAEDLIADYEDYFAGLVDEKRNDPGDDIISYLLAAEVDGDRLTVEEVVVLSFSVFGAGFDTTQHMIGNAVNALIDAPDQQQLLRDEPGLMRAAVDEFLRFDGSVMFTERAALEPLVFGEKEYPRGASFYLGLGAANRDPEAYDEPDRLDVRRKKPQPLTMGGGIHFCVGAALGRLETELAMTSLLARAPHIDRAGPATWKKSVVIRGLDSLPVTTTTGGSADVDS
jgi:cytochrome P450